MRYDEPLFRPPSEADSFILQATLGCSWNACTYCAMYRGKRYTVRPLDEVLADIAEAGARFADEVRHVFVADGDPLGMATEHWEPILRALAAAFPRLRRVSTYATARNLLEKTPEELQRLRELGLSLLYIGPESGDDATLRRIAKGADAAAHVEAARKAREAGMEQSLIFPAGRGRSRAQRGPCPGLGPPRHGHGPALPLHPDPHRHSWHADGEAGGWRPLRAAGCPRPAAGAALVRG